ncbi:MAG: hypothetical protein WC750_02555 [Patescibacteria group bacterium]|jgi:hypothetical protein
MFEPIKYKNLDPDADDARKAEETEFYTLHLDCQILAEWFEALAKNPPPWYPAGAQLDDWNINDRITELETRPDLRLGYMLKGFAETMPHKTTRAMTSAVQASFLNRIRENDERLAVDQIRMFSYEAQMPHTNRAERFDKLVARINWKDDSPPTKAFITMVIASCMNEERQYFRQGIAKTFHEPPLTNLSLLESIPMDDYIRAIDEKKVIEIMHLLRKRQARHECLTPEQELEIVTIEWLVKQLPTASFRPVFNAIREKLRFSESSEPEEKPAENKAADEATVEEDDSPESQDIFARLAAKGDSPKVP